MSQYNSKQLWTKLKGLYRISTVKSKAMLM